MQVELRNIHKHFGKVHANAGINLTTNSGAIQGILGENGAGKSTLMKILSGFVQPDSGEILLDGTATKITSPADAINQGIGMLHQDPLDFPPMKVLDNFLIGQPGGLVPNRSHIKQEFTELQNQFGFSLNPDAYVDMLTVGERQQLEILRLLWLGARVLILDEPTTGISSLQKEKLFAALKLLSSQGKAIIFVSHKLEDVGSLCDSVAVLRQGKLVGIRQPPLDEDDLISLMFETTLTPLQRQPCATCDRVLSISDLAVEENRIKVSGMNLDLCRGEVVGVVGMEGSGQSALLRSCAGILPAVHGSIVVNGKNLTGKTYHDFMKEGVAFLPASRMEEGLIPGLTLSEHFALAESNAGFFIDYKSTEKLAEKRISEFSVKGVPSTRVEQLSGGNQQRALLAMLREPLNLMLLEHPTRGLDIESGRYIWRKLKERCRQGTAILFISPDLEEVLQYSDRILVFFSGRVSHPLQAAGTSVDELGLLISGKDWDEIVSGEVNA